MVIIPTIPGLPDPDPGVLVVSGSESSLHNSIGVGSGFQNMIGF